MDYQFLHDKNAQPSAVFAMGGETLGQWFTQELGDDQQKIIALLDVIEQLEKKEISEYRLIGSEYDLELNADEVEVLSHRLDYAAPDELPEGTELYDQESMSGCGMEDFKDVLMSWVKFIGG
ncbi:MAG: hypothetical protein ACI88A_003914 [Paraglaciecola sp.]|jgi:uncharacterized protein YacL (UPF0231 family)